MGDSDGSAAPRPTEPEPTTFEDALERLEGIVDRLERGDLSLEEALAAFEEGVALTRRCAARLEDAERRIEVLVREGRKWVERPFAGDEATGSRSEESD